MDDVHKCVGRDPASFRITDGDIDNTDYGSWWQSSPTTKG